MKDTLIFDTHAYVKKLKAVGFTEEQAEVQAEAMSGLIEEGLATKRDLKELELRLSIRLGTIMTAGVAAIAVLMKLFSH
ncbi:MAG: DUF1640 domain-containing protein [Nitrospirae bacterium]|nr:DUF1640 domain-containing protein [Nitrospirota bacterium]MBF0592571.1 DUF1640 domain-containing protein [Nitrospirota bacterium]